MDSGSISLLGVDDLDAILAVPAVHAHEQTHAVTDGAPASFAWDYSRGARPQLDRLYEKGKTAQWNSSDLPWDADVDQERQAAASFGMGLRFADMTGTCFEKWGDPEWMRLDIELQNWVLSQFLHGEQGALLCTAKIVETVPSIDAKYFAATQVMDEARHAEVFARYLDTKLSGHYPLNPHLGLLLDDIISDSRWDMTYLGMQVMVEGLALAAFGIMHMLTEEPLLKELLRKVMADEARHVAFGVLSLRDFYAELSDAEMRERQEFAFEAAVHMRDRLLFSTEVWETVGVDPREAIGVTLRTPAAAAFSQVLFSKIVPNCKKLGLLDASGGWLRDRFTDIGIIGFEDHDGFGDPELDAAA